MCGYVFPSSEQVNSDILVKMESIENWHHIVATSALGVHAWSVGLALAAPSILSTLLGLSPRVPQRM